MLDLKRIRSETDRVREAIAFKKTQADLDRYLLLDEERRELLVEAERLKHERNAVSEEIGRLKKAGQDAADKVQAMKRVGEMVKELDARIADLEMSLQKIAEWIPNVPHPSVPRAEDASGNVIVREAGTIRKFDFQPKPHWQLAESLGLLDFERAGKIAGAGFLLFTGRGARLERALIRFMIDLAVRRGYTEVWAPHLVRRECLFGTGQLPKFADDLFRAGDYWLIPTAEVTVTNIHRDEIVDGAALPIRYVAGTPCFRAEAGAAGRDTRGLIRLHQFDKVELVWFSRPEASFDALERLTGHAEEVLRRLGLPYRVVSLSTGDLGFGAAKTYDIEVWLPGQNAYREISSCSNFTDFQARRANIRFRATETEKPEFVHTLNGSGVAIGRTIVAILENGQREDGSVEIPAALVPYMGGLSEIRSR